MSEGPVRKIPPGRRSFRGHYIRRNGESVDYESDLERNFLYLSDYDPSVREIVSQPVRIGGHVPDFKLVTLRGDYLIDVKPEGLLVKVWADDKAKFDETADHCERNGMSYGFFTDSVRDAMANRIAVLKYVDQYGKYELISSEVSEAAYSAVDDSPARVSDICSKFGPDLDYTEKKIVLATLAYRGRAILVEAPTLEFNDAKLVRTTTPKPLDYLIPYEQIEKRVRTHPIRFLSGPHEEYREGMSSLTLGGHAYDVIDSSQAWAVQVRSKETGEEYRIPLDTFQGAGGRLTTLALRGGAKYDNLIRRGEVIGALCAKDSAMEADKLAASKLLDLSVRQVERLAARFRLNGIDSLLRPQTRILEGLRRSRLQPESEAILDRLILEAADPKSHHGLHGNPIFKAWQAEVASVNKLRAENDRLEVAHISTVFRRINALAPRALARKRKGTEFADNLLGTYGGSFPNGNRPLETVLIDHTPVDDLTRLKLGVVDPESGKLTFRAELTVMLDTFSRAILAFEVNLKRPNANDVGLTILMGAQSKEKYVQGYGMSEWPVQGLPGTIQFDNAKEFRARLIASGCAEFGIQVSHRPVGQPRFGGRIERFFNTLSRKIHEFPGTTGSNTDDRADYDSVKNATLTVEQLEELIALAIDEYHHTKHEGLDGLTPLEKWHQGVQQHGMPRQLATDDEWRFRKSFLPALKRQVKRDGVVLWGVRFYSPELAAIRERDSRKEARRVAVRYDPNRFTEEVYVYDEMRHAWIVAPSTKQIGVIHLRDWQRATKRAKSRGRGSPSEKYVADIHGRMMKRLDEMMKENKQLAKSVHATKREQDVADKILPKVPRQDISPPPPIDYFPDPLRLREAVKQGRAGGEKK